MRAMIFCCFSHFRIPAVKITIAAFEEICHSDGADEEVEEPWA